MTDEPQTAPVDVDGSTDRPSNVLSCRRFLGYSIALTVLFLIAHVAGLREHTAALSGTGVFTDTTRFFGVAYILLYVCFVGIVPILLIATVLVGGLAAFWRLRK